MNKDAWEKVAETFAGGLYLPAWGVFQELRDVNLLGDIKGKTFLEIGYGSGHSAQYLLNNGAKKVYGIDISEEQRKLATKLNSEYIKEGKVTFNVSPMEDRITLPEKVDIVFSVYAIGWTTSPEITFKNIKSYLKPGGRFIWSWEHPFYSRVETENNKLVMDKSYVKECAKLVFKWSGSDGAYIQHRKISTWINELVKAGFEIENMYEPSPEVFAEEHMDKKRYYSKFRASYIPSSIVFDCRLK